MCKKKNIQKKVASLPPFLSQRHGSRTLKINFLHRSSYIFYKLSFKKIEFWPNFQKSQVKSAKKIQPILRIFGICCFDSVFLKNHFYPSMEIWYINSTLGIVLNQVDFTFLILLQMALYHCSKPRRNSKVHFSPVF